MVPVRIAPFQIAPPSIIARTNPRPSSRPQPVSRAKPCAAPKARQSRTGKSRRDGQPKAASAAAVSSTFACAGHAGRPDCRLPAGATGTTGLRSLFGQPDRPGAPLGRACSPGQPAARGHGTPVVARASQETSRNKAAGYPAALVLCRWAPLLARYSKSSLRADPGLLRPKPAPLSHVQEMSRASLAMASSKAPRWIGFIRNTSSGRRPLPLIAASFA